MLSKLKIIFLDVDGVLNVIPEGTDKFGDIFHSHFIDNLKVIVDTTGAKIVLSASSKKNGLDIIQQMWKYRNYPGEVIDITPSLYLKFGGCIQFWNDKLTRNPTEKIHGYSIPRGCEIEYWLKNESSRFGVIENYVIIDDDDDMLLNQHDNYVKCSDNISDYDCIDIGFGLTDSCTNMAIEILNKAKS